MNGLGPKSRASQCLASRDQRARPSSRLVQIQPFPKSMELQSFPDGADHRSPSTCRSLGELAAVWFQRANCPAFPWYEYAARQGARKAPNAVTLRSKISRFSGNTVSCLVRDTTDVIDVRNYICCEVESTRSNWLGDRSTGWDQTGVQVAKQGGIERLVPALKCNKCVRPAFQTQHTLAKKTVSLIIPITQAVNCQGPQSIRHGVLNATRDDRRIQRAFDVLPRIVDTGLRPTNTGRVDHRQKR
jgi:hypothetical protein